MHVAFLLTSMNVQSVSNKFHFMFFFTFFSQNFKVVSFFDTWNSSGGKLASILGNERNTNKELDFSHIFCVFSICFDAVF